MKPRPFRSPFRTLNKRKELARSLGIPTSILTQILKRKFGASYELAHRLELTTNTVKEVWLDWKESRHCVYLSLPLQSKTKKRSKSFWGDRGHKADVARAVRILPASLSNIIHRRARASWKIAKRLERMTGVHTFEWMDCQTSTHPAFYGKPLANVPHWQECPEVNHPFRVVLDAAKNSARKPSRVIQP